MARTTEQLGATNEQRTSEGPFKNHLFQNFHQDFSASGLICAAELVL